MTVDPHVTEIKRQVALKKARYAELRSEASSRRGAEMKEFMEMMVLLQEINYLELSYRREDGVCNFLKEPELSICS